MAGRRRSDRALRGKLHSPRRPPIAQQEHRPYFWVLIAVGKSSEDAATGAGVSVPVGAQWFQKSGGMPPSTLAPSSKLLSGRYLSFAERGEIATQHAQGARVRQIALHMGRSGSTISRELRRNAATVELLRIAEVIAKKKAGLQLLEEPLADTTIPAGRMVLTMFAGVAEFERALIRHRTDEGRKAAKHRGVSFGRPQELRSDQKTLALSLVEEGRSISEVARTFNIHPATIHRCLNTSKAANSAL